MTISSKTTRRADRALLHAAASLTTEDGVKHFGWTRDISANGLYLATNDPIPLGTRCTVCLTIRDENGPHRLTISGQVARRDEAGLGIHFVDRNPETNTVIQKLVNSLLEKI